MGIRSEQELDDIVASEEEHDRQQRRYYDPGKVEITKGDPSKDAWLHGRVRYAPGYTFEAKVFDTGSEHGLDGGRISKLHLFRGDKEVAAFERGWAENDKPRAWDVPTQWAMHEVKAAFAKDFEQEQTTEAQASESIDDAAPAPMQDVAGARPVNPMGFFKKDEPAKTWASRDTSGERFTMADVDRADDHENDA